MELAEKVDKMKARVDHVVTNPEDEPHDKEEVKMHAKPVGNIEKERCSTAQQDKIVEINKNLRDKSDIKLRQINIKWTPRVSI